MDSNLRAENRMLKEQLEIIVNENKQLKEELENKIDLYEDTISYQLGFDKGKEYMQQRIDKAKEYIKTHSEMTDLQICGIENVLAFRGNLKELLAILGDGNNE